MMHCEHCQDTIESVEVAHSMVIVLQRVTHDGYSYVQCDAGQEYGGLTYQHFGCSPECMLSMVRDCISSHFNEHNLIAVSPQQVRLHRTVLSAHLACKVCQLALTTEAWRFCLTVATPENRIPDDSQNELGEWTCSLEHARQSAMKTLEGLV